MFDYDDLSRLEKNIHRDNRISLFFKIKDIGLKESPEIATEILSSINDLISSLIKQHTTRLSEPPIVSQYYLKELRKIADSPDRKMKLRGELLFAFIMAFADKIVSFLRSEKMREINELTDELSESERDNKRSEIENHKLPMQPIYIKVEDKKLTFFMQVSDGTEKNICNVSLADIKSLEYVLPKEMPARLDKRTFAMLATVLTPEDQRRKLDDNLNTFFEHTLNGLLFFEPSLREWYNVPTDSRIGVVQLMDGRYYDNQVHLIANNKKGLEEFLTIRT